MERNFRKNIMDELGRRAQLSMLGKGIIGLVGGIIILFITWLRTCNKDSKVELESPKVQWFTYNIISLATTLDSSKRVAHFKKFGINGYDADSVASLISTRSKGGVVVRELTKEGIDSLNKTTNYSIPTADSTYMIFYMQSLKDNDFVIVMKDSLIKDIISVLR